MSLLPDQGGSALTVEQILDFSGEDDIGNVSLVVLRGLGLRDVSMLRLAPTLTSVSLSHNDLKTIELPANSLPLLTELNINRNNFTSLSFLACCPNLEKFFAAANHIVDITLLGGCSKLSTVCLNGNDISDLSAAVLALKKLGALRELELDGNPCESATSYRHVLVNGLTELRLLDGEAIQPTERESARHVVAYDQRVGTFYTHSDISAPKDKDGAAKQRPQRRPTTSHAHTAQYARSQNRTTPALLAQSLAGTSMSYLESQGLRNSSNNRNRSNQPFRDEFLNNNPILAEYMAAAQREEEDEGTLERGPSDHVGEVGSDEEDDADIRFIDSDASSQASTRPHSSAQQQHQGHGATSKASNAAGKGSSSAAASKRKGFATELRQVTGTLGLVEGHSPEEIARLLEDGEGPAPGESFADTIERSLRPLTSGGVPKGWDGKEDPHVVIARLLETIEKLQNGAGRGGVRELEREVKMLRAENLNMRYLQEECTSLREQNEKLRDALASNEHVSQNARLKTQLKNLQARYKRLSEEAVSYGRPQTAAGCNRDMIETSALLEEVDEYDAELADLVRKNVEMLSQIKEDLRETQTAMWDAEVE